MRLIGPPTMDLISRTLISIDTNGTMSSPAQTNNETIRTTMRVNLTTTQLINETQTTNNVQSSKSALPTTSDVSTTIEISTETTSSSTSFFSTFLETTALSTNQRTSKRTIADSSPTEIQPDMTSSTPVTLSSIMTTWDTTTKQQGMTTNEGKILASQILNHKCKKKSLYLQSFLFIL